MKKLETLKKALESTVDKKTKLVTDKALEEKLREIANNEATDLFESFTRSDALALLQFAELEKALKVRDKYEFVLDINYADYKSTQIKLTQMSLLNNKQKRALHLYQHNDYFDICFSCSKATREKREAIEELIKTLYNYKFENDTTVLKHIHFDELVNACKFALIILESSIDELIEYAEKQTKAE